MRAHASACFRLRRREEVQEGLQSDEKRGDSCEAHMERKGRAFLHRVVVFCPFHGDRAVGSFRRRRSRPCSGEGQIFGASVQAIRPDTRYESGVRRTERGFLRPRKRHGLEHGQKRRFLYGELRVLRRRESLPDRVCPRWTCVRYDEEQLLAPAEGCPEGAGERLPEGPRKGRTDPGGVRG